MFPVRIKFSAVPSGTEPGAETPRISRKSELISQSIDLLAERVGFEPTIRFWRILTFQASAFDHSATAPHALERAP